MGFGFMCEVLGVPPSYLYKKFPEMTTADISFMKKYGYYKIMKQIEFLAKAMKGNKQ